MADPHASDPNRHVDRLWHDAAAVVEADLRDDAVAEAFEVYRAEIARSRLVDRVGEVVVTLSCGVDLRGRLLQDEPVADCLVVRAPEGVRWIIPIPAVLVLHGGEAGLRPETELAPERLTSVLRRAEGSALELHLRDGRRWQVSLVAVASDHAVLLQGTSQRQMLVPFTSVEAWGLT